MLQLGALPDRVDGVWGLRTASSVPRVVNLEKVLAALEANDRRVETAAPPPPAASRTASLANGNAPGEPPQEDKASVSEVLAMLKDKRRTPRPAANAILSVDAAEISRQLQLCVT